MIKQKVIQGFHLFCLQELNWGGANSMWWSWICFFSETKNVNKKESFFNEKKYDHHGKKIEKKITIF